MIFVLATIEIQPGRRNDFLAEFQKIVPLVRKEDGCLLYTPTCDVPTELPAQPPLRNDTVIVVEQWESLDALAAHLIAPHMVAYRPKVKEMVVKTTLQVLGEAKP